MKLGRDLIDLPTPVQPVTVHTPTRNIVVRARPLSIAEVQQLLLLARKSGWLGSHELTDFLVDHGLSRDPTARRFIRQDAFLTCNAAREVWILTLQNTAAYTLNLAMTLGVRPPLEVRRYSYSELATPGTMLLLSEDLERLDTERFMHSLLDSIIVSGRVGDQRLTKQQTMQKFAEHLEIGVIQLLASASDETDPLSKLPETIFRSLSERFCAYLSLMRMPDWNQYANILFVFNSLANVLSFHSNQLGGLDTSLWDAKLVTGTPGIFALIKPQRVPPHRILSAVATDLIRGSNEKLNDPLRTTLHQFLDRAREEMTADLATESRPSEKAVVTTLLNRFARLISTQKDLGNTLCTLYWPEFCAYFDDERGRLADTFTSDFHTFNLPDCYLLVEGPSDELCFSHFVKLSANGDARVRVLDCGSSQRVVRRYRDLLDQSFIGGIVTIVDADATSEHAELQRLLRGKCTVSHFICEPGTLEDLFPASMHVAALNLQFPDGSPIETSELSKHPPILKSLSKVLWQRKRAQFDKVAHARALIALIQTRNRIPRRAAEIVRKACRIAHACAATQPRPLTYLSVDAESRRFGRQVAELLSRSPTAAQQAAPRGRVGVRRVDGGPNKRVEPTPGKRRGSR